MSQEVGNGGHVGVRAEVFFPEGVSLFVDGEISEDEFVAAIAIEIGNRGDMAHGVDATGDLPEDVKSTVESKRVAGHAIAGFVFYDHRRRVIIPLEAGDQC